MIYCSAICLILHSHLQLEQQVVHHLLLCNLLLCHLLLCHLMLCHLLLCHLLLCHLLLCHLLLQLRASSTSFFGLLHSHLLLKGRAGHRPQRHRKKNALLGASHLG